MTDQDSHLIAVGMLEFSDRTQSTELAARLREQALVRAVLAVAEELRALRQAMAAAPGEVQS